MTSQYRHRRTSNPATPAPTLEPGEIAVNTANRQISLGDAAAGTLGTPKPLLAIRIFDIAAIYAIGDMVTNADKIWRAIVANGPGAFNAAQWELAASQVTISSNPPSNAVAGSMWWDSDNGMLYVRYNDGDSSQWVQATAMPVVDTTAFVQKAGDVMTGALTIQYANPQFAINKLASGQQAILVSRNNGVTRWVVNLGSAATEPGDGSGSNFAIARYNDAGGAIDNPISIARSTGLVALTGDPTAALGVATKQYVDARAGDAMAYSGMQINGSMEVSQERGATAAVITSGWPIDGWRMDNSSGAVVTSGQYSPATPGFVNILGAIVGTGVGSIPAGGFCSLSQNIEGYRIIRLAWGTANAKPITICFWTAHNRTGLYTGIVRNADGSRCYAFSYTQSVSNAYEYKTVTVLGCTDGTWLTNNSTGLAVIFSMGAGTTFTAPSLNTWLNANYTAGPGQVNAIAATTDVFRLTGVVVLPGTQAPTAAQSPLLMRPYGQELLTCQRYYYGCANEVVGLSITSSICSAYYFPVVMRAAPTVLATFAAGAGAAGTFSSAGASTRGAAIYNPSANWTVGAVLSLAPVSLDARL